MLQHSHRSISRQWKQGSILDIQMVGWGSTATLFRALFRHSKRKNRTVRDAALSEDWWVRDVDYNMTEQIIAEFVILWAYLHNIELHPDPAQEKTIIWLHTSDGQYTVKSAYDLQVIGKHPSQPTSPGERRHRQNAVSSPGLCCRIEFGLLRASSWESGQMITSANCALETLKQQHIFSKIAPSLEESGTVLEGGLQQQR